VDEIIAANKVQEAVAALDLRITDIANMEKITCRPTKLVQAVIDLQVDAAAQRHHMHINTLPHTTTTHTPAPKTNLITIAPQRAADRPGPSTTQGNTPPAPPQ
jgi:ferredoxin-NADP reductase